MGIPEGFITPESGRSNHENRNKATKKPRAHVANGNLRSGKGVGNFLQDAKTMGERELEWAISVTEGKLKTLRNAMGKGNGKSSAGHQDEDEFSEEDLEELERFVKDEL